jgi:hypothetical protein
LPSGVEVAVFNLLGRLYLDPAADQPFAAIDAALAACPATARIRVIDFHAEATSEKVALAWYLDGRASLLFGTHTHVATADERILRKGTAYVTDVGMTGPRDSVLGRDPKPVIARFRTFERQFFAVATKGPSLATGVLVEVEVATGAARSIERIALPAEADYARERP